MYNLQIKDRYYTCKFTTQACIESEKKLGTNPINVFMKASEGEIPKLSDLMTIFHGCLSEYNHGISLQDSYKIYDDYCAEGGNIISFISVLVDILKDSGFIPKDNNSKN